MKKKFNYPFTAVLGQDQLKLALTLNMIDPNISGVLIMGDRGTAKSTTVRSLLDLLPEISVVKNDPLNRPPFDASFMEAHNEFTKRFNEEHKGKMPTIRRRKFDKEIINNSMQILKKIWPGSASASFSEENKSKNPRFLPQLMLEEKQKFLNFLLKFKFFTFLLGIKRFKKIKMRQPPHRNPPYLKLLLEPNRLLLNRLYAVERDDIIVPPKDKASQRWLNDPNNFKIVPHPSGQRPLGDYFKIDQNFFILSNFHNQKLEDEITFNNGVVHGTKHGNGVIRGRVKVKEGRSKILNKARQKSFKASGKAVRKSRPKVPMLPTLPQIQRGTGLQIPRPHWGQRRSKQDQKNYRHSYFLDSYSLTMSLKNSFKRKTVIMKIDQSKENRKIPLITLPLGATEDRVCGTLDIEKALRDGVKSFEPGLLAKANRGILYVDEVNLLDDHLVDVLLDSAASGVNTVEREGISLTHPAKFMLIGSGNPEEGDLRPQLLDRFGMYVEIKTIKEPELRTKIVNERLNFETEPQTFINKYANQQEKLKTEIEEARQLILADKIEISSELQEKISIICSKLKVDGIRGDIICTRAAKALAAFQKKTTVDRDDIMNILVFCLSHRLPRVISAGLVSSTEAAKIIKGFGEKVLYADSYEYEADSENPF